MFGVVENAMLADYPFENKASARKFFQQVTQAFIDWNQTPSDSPDFAPRRDGILKMVSDNTIQK
jgi:hypothetical protein